MLDRPPDLSMSEQAIDNLMIRIADRKLSRYELLIIFTNLRWMVTLKDGWFFVWSPVENPYEHHLTSDRYASATYLDLLARLEAEIRTVITGLI